MEAVEDVAELSLSDVVMVDLPAELWQHVFSYLGPEDLSACSAVCSRWHSLTNLDKLWRRHANTHQVVSDLVYPLLPEPAGRLETSCEWKASFTEFVGRVRRQWKAGGKTMNIEKAGCVVESHSCDGLSLAVSFMGQWVDVYDVMSAKHLHHESMGCFPGLERVTTDIDSNTLCVAKSNFVIVCDRTYNYMTKKFVLDHKWKLSPLESIRGQHIPGVLSQVHLVDGAVWFTESNGHALLLDTDAGVVRAHVEDASLYMKISKWMLCVWEDYAPDPSRPKQARLELFSARGKSSACLEVTCVEVQCFRNVGSLLAFMLTKMDKQKVWREVMVWDFHSDTKVNFTVWGKVSLALSASYLVAASDGPNGLIKVYQPQSGQLLWQRAYEPLRPLLNVKNSLFAIITNKYLALPDSQHLLDLKNNTTVPLSSSVVLKFKHIYGHSAVYLVSDFNGTLIVLKTFL